MAKGVFSMLSGPKKGPSAAEIQAQADAAAKKERERLTEEQATKDRAAQEKNLASLQDQEAKRAAFAGVLNAAGEEDAGRKKFLKGV